MTVTKPFNRLEVEAVDDGSFILTVYPVVKKDENGDGPSPYDNFKKFSFEDGAKMISKIEGLCGGADPLEMHLKGHLPRFQKDTSVPGSEGDS